MNDMNPDIPTTDDERAAILAGLAELKRQLPLRKLTIKYGARSTKPNVRHQLFLTGHEDQAWKAIVAACSIAVSRPVSKVLVMRLALSHLMVTCARSLADPVTQARLKDDLLRVREERASEHER